MGWANRHKEALPDLLSAPIPGLLRRLAVPAGAGFFFLIMLQAVDTFFAGLVSTQALAALSIAFPVYWTMLGFGQGLYVGTATMVSNAIGAGRPKLARTYVAQALLLALAGSVVLTVVGWLGSAYMFRKLGAQGEYLAIAVSYMDVLLAGTVFIFINQVLNALLSAVGDTAAFRNVAAAAFVLNLGLNPWLMFGGLGIPPLGFAGIAWATVILQAGGTVFLVHRARRTGLLTRNTPATMRPRWEPLGELLRQSLPASLNVLVIALGFGVFYYFIGRYGEDAVAAFGVAKRIENIIELPAMGLSVAVLGIAGQSKGVGAIRRARQTWLSAMRWGFGVTSAVAVVAFVFARQLMWVFSQDESVLDIGTFYLRIAALIVGANALTQITVGVLRGLKRPTYAPLMNICRFVIAPLLVFPFLSQGLGWGLPGIWWAFVVIALPTVAVTALYASRVLSSERKASRVPTTHAPPEIQQLGGMTTRRQG